MIYLNTSGMKSNEAFSVINKFFMTQNEITFETLPMAVLKILTEMEEIKKIISRPVKESIFNEKLSFKNALELLSNNGYQISESKLYKLTSANKIPHAKLNNKLIFYKKELSQWLDSQIVKNRNTFSESQYSVILSSQKHIHGER